MDNRKRNNLVHPDNPPLKKKETITDRAHESLQKAKDLRKRRSSVQLEGLDLSESSALLIPGSLKVLNAVARIWCVGAGPKASRVHVVAVKLFLLGNFLSLVWCVNVARVRGNISFLLQICLIILQVR